MAEKKFSDLTTASQINETDIAAISQESNGVWGSFKATIGAIAQKIITGINFANAFNTNAKTVAGAVNEKLTSTAVADVEVSPAESAHSEGDYLIYNGLLYLVIDDIAIGDALTTGAGGNIEVSQITDGIGGGGGHEILNDAGSALPQENKMQFKGVYVHDDSTNGKTVVENYREMTKAQFDLLTADEKKGDIFVTDENGHPIIASEVGFDPTGTSFSSTDSDGVLREIDSDIDDINTDIGTINNSINLLNAKIQRKEFLQKQNLDFDNIPQTCTGFLFLRGYTSSTSGFWFLIPFNVYSGSATIDTPFKVGSFGADPTGASYSNGTLTVTMSSSTSSYFATLIYGA